MEYLLTKTYKKVIYMGKSQQSTVGRLSVNKFSNHIYRVNNVSCGLDSKENRYVLVSNIPRTFLLADMNDNMHKLLEGTIEANVPSIIQKTHLV